MNAGVPSVSNNSDVHCEVLGSDGREGFYSFPQLKGCEPHQEPLLQPLSGLDADAVSEALDPFGVSQEFKDAVLERGRIQ